MSAGTTTTTNGSKTCNLFFSLPFDGGSQNDDANKSSFDHRFSSTNELKVGLEKQMEKLQLLNMASALFAIDHVNQRNGSLVTELASEAFKKCNIRIPSIHVADSSQKEKLDTNFSSIIMDEMGLQHLDSISVYMPGFMEDDSLSNDICAIIGPFHGDNELGFISNENAIPYILPFNIIDSFHNTTKYPHTKQISARYSMVMHYLLEYLVDCCKRNFIGFIYDNGYEGSEAVKLLHHVNRETFRLTIEGHGYSQNASTSEDDAIENVLKRFESSKYSTIIFIVTGHIDVARLIKAADANGLLEDEYMWVLIGRDLSAFMTLITSLSR